jgi:hypothetical protein
MWSFIGSNIQTKGEGHLTSVLDLESIPETRVHGYGRLEGED